MPIYINYAAEAASEWETEKWVIQNPVHGKNEINSKEQWRFAKRGFEAAERRMTFGTGYKKSTKKWGDVVIDTHAWLSENIEGPWLLQDGWCNQGHSYDCHIHIERFDQRDKFEKSECGQYFSRHDGENSFFGDHGVEMSNIAIIKGLVAPIGPTESFAAWESLHYGYVSEEAVVNGVKSIRYSFDHKGVEKSFVEALVEDGTFKAEAGGGYICPKNEYIDDDILDRVYEWQKQKTGICCNSGGKAGDPAFHKYEFPYPDIEEEFKASWGGHFHYDKTAGLYFCSMDEYPYTKKREVSPEFVAYMHGRGPDPSLKLV